MPTIPFENISNSEYYDEFESRLGMDKLEAGKVYTFHGQVKGLAAKAITATVRLGNIKMDAHSDNCLASSVMEVLDDDLKRVDHFHSRLLHGIWTPDRNKNIWSITRLIFRSEVQLGYFTNYDDIDLSELMPALDVDILPELDPELIDA